MIYFIGFLFFFIVFLCVLFFGGRIDARAWWDKTHIGLVKEAVSRLAACGEKEAAAFFEQNMDRLLSGATAPDRIGDIDSALAGGAHYCIVKRKRRGLAQLPLEEGLFFGAQASYFKRAGVLWDFSGAIRAQSPYLKTACTIAEENYSTALFYAVRFRSGGRAKDLAFASDCLGRALHGIADAAAIPHSVGKRYLGKKSYHYRFESFAASLPFFEEKTKRTAESAQILQAVREKWQNTAFRGGFVRRSAETLAVRSAALYYAGKETVEKSLVGSVLSDTADACAAVMLLFYLEMMHYDSCSEILLGKKNCGDNDCILTGAYGTDAEGAIPVKLSLCEEFPAFSIEPLSDNEKLHRAFSGCFRIVRSEAGKFYLTASRRDFKRILRVGKRIARLAVFMPKKKQSFVSFFEEKHKKNREEAVL